MVKTVRGSGVIMTIKEQLQHGELSLYPFRLYKGSKLVKTCAGTATLPSTVLYVFSYVQMTAEHNTKFIICLTITKIKNTYIISDYIVSGASCYAVCLCNKWTSRPVRYTKLQI